MKRLSHRTAVVFTLMLALHVMVGWLLVAASSRSAAPGASARVTVFVVPWAVRPPVPAAQATDRQRGEPGAANRAARPAPGPAPTAAFAPLAVPAVTMEPTAGAGPAAAGAEPAASEPQARPLNLALPRLRNGPRGSAGALLGEALDDPRIQAPRGGIGERMARALGSDRTLIEEPLNGDSVRLRQGTDCAIVSRSRESQLDPFNQSANPSARGVTPCR